MSPIEMLIDAWAGNLNHALALLKDIPAGRMTHQPASVVNHPAWTIAHLCHYHPAILSLARGEPVSDPGKLPDAPQVDAGSAPTDEPAAYLSKDELIARFREGHEQIEETLRAAPDDLLDRPPGLERWRPAFPRTGQALTYLMLLHESTHLGELAAWRRAAGYEALE